MDWVIMMIIWGKSRGRHYEKDNFLLKRYWNLTLGEISNANEVAPLSCWDNKNCLNIVWNLVLLSTQDWYKCTLCISMQDWYNCNIQPWNLLETETYNMQLYHAWYSRDSGWMHWQEWGAVSKCYSDWGRGAKLYPLTLTTGFVPSTSGLTTPLFYWS